MILAKGKCYDSSMQDAILSEMEAQINETLATKTLPMETVIDAIDALSRKLAAGAFDSLLASLSIDGAEVYRDQAVRMLSREHLEFKVRTELGPGFRPDYVTDPPPGFSPHRVTAMPLGVLLHIAAGNVDGLPAYSTAEGLLTGNINILKLPQADQGLTVAILQAAIEIEPALADFLYVFDTPSTDIAAIRKMAAMADGIAVWGGDAAVAAVRRYAAPGVKLIEWGHKLSFAYISGYQDREADLSVLARHIIATKQLLCSSCQTIYLDTEDMEEVYRFCRTFLPYLEDAALAQRPATLGGAAEVTLLRYTRHLESVLDGGGGDEFRGALCGLIPCQDQELVLSGLFGTCPVKRLPQKDVLRVLRRKKNYLQTAGLICPQEKRAALTDLLARAGLVRITGPGEMSDAFPGEAHDGEYPLRRYLRIVDSV